MTTDNKNEVTLAPSYGCQSSYQTLDLSQVIFFKSDDAFAQTDGPEKMPANPTDNEIIVVLSQEQMMGRAIMPQYHSPLRCSPIVSHEEV